MAVHLLCLLHFTSLFKQVCHSDKWVKEMVKSAPFKNQNDLLKKGARAWSKCKEKDWLEALEGHPRIGQKAKGSSLSAKWSKGEQSAAKSPDEQVLERLAEAQQDYFEKFGFIFLICAMLPQSTGNVPLSLLAVSLISVTCVMLDHSAGRDPDSWLL